MQLTRLIQRIGMFVLVGILITAAGCSDKSGKDSQASKDNTAAQQSAKPRPQQTDTIPPGVKSSIDSRIPWTPGGAACSQRLRRLERLMLPDVRLFSDFTEPQA